MTRWFLALAVLVLGPLSLAGTVEARELDQSELRALSASGRSTSLSRIYRRVRTATGGEPVDVRAFDVGRVFFRILVMMPNGSVGSVIVDAQNGAFVPPGSRTAAMVSAEASASPGKSGSAPGRSGNRGQGQGQGQGQGGGQGNGGGNGGGGGGGGGGNGGGNNK